MWKELHLIARSVTRVWNLVQGCLSTRVPPILVYWSERTRSSKMSVAPMFNHSFWINRSSIKILLEKNETDWKQNSQQSLGQVAVGRPCTYSSSNKGHITLHLPWKILHGTVSIFKGKDICSPLIFRVLQSIIEYYRVLQNITEYFLRIYLDQFLGLFLLQYIYFSDNSMKMWFFLAGRWVVFYIFEASFRK